MSARTASAIAALVCVIFILCAVPWIDRPGIQTDEALFAAGIYPPFAPANVVNIGNREIPLMVMTYVGALKSHTWALLFRVWEPSPATVRIPAILLSAVSIWWVYRLIFRTAGIPAALAVCAILATDPVYLWYSRIDHGPVVIQHLCFVGAMLALVRFHQERSILWLGAGFFALGLGMWEKAIFIWLLSGLCIAGAAVCWREIRSALSVRNVAVASAAFLLGVSPLLIYNFRNDFVTFRSNTAWSSDILLHKVKILRSTLEGNLLFGFIMREPWDGTPPRELTTSGEHLVSAVATASKSPRRTVMGYLAIAAVLLVPFTRRTPAFRWFWFVLICGSVAWLQMAFNQNTGTAGHHTILLWPLPVIAIGTVIVHALHRLPRRGPAFTGAVIAIACMANLLVLNTYYANLNRHGGTPTWTDAMYPAFDAIRHMRKDAVCTIDWGFIETLRLFDDGRSAICGAPDPKDEASRRVALHQISQPGHVFLTHTEGNEAFPGITARFVQFAEVNGFARINHRVFADANGRKTVELFQFAKRP